MRTGWAPDPGIDAIHARAAVLINEAEQLPTGALLTAVLTRIHGRSMDVTTAVRATALWDRLTGWCQAQSMVTCAKAGRVCLRA
jgi:hypothetical protein